MVSKKSLLTPEDYVQIARLRVQHSPSRMLTNSQIQRWARRIQISERKMANTYEWFASQYGKTYER